MTYKPPSNKQIVEALTPWFSPMSRVFRDAETRHLEAVGIMGVPRRGERAGDMHRTLRTLFREWCDETNGMFELVEEPEGKGLDYVICHLIDQQRFVIRFGRYNGEVVKRNGTHRQNEARACGMLSSEFLFGEPDETDRKDLRQVTMAYTIENEGTENGKPAWYMAEILLIREMEDGVERLAKLDSFSKPASIAEDKRRVVAVPRQEELREWRRLIDGARRTG